MNKGTNLIKSILLCIFGFIVIIVAQVISNTISNLMGKSIYDYIFPIIYIIIAFIIILSLTKFSKENDYADLGVKYTRINPYWILIGILLPIILNVLTILLNDGEFKVHSMDNIYSVIITSLLGGALAPALVEELVFRGYLFSNVQKLLGRTAAILIPSIIFAASHLINGHLNFVSFFLLLIAGTAVGVMFTTIRIATGSIWAGVIVHAFWDFLVAGDDNKFLAITQNADHKASIFNYILHSDSLILTGGQYGIETSTIAILIYIIASLFIYKKMNKSINL